MTERNQPLTFQVGDHELVIRRRYEVVSIVNDLMIGGWFLIGSLLFLSPTTTHTGTWLFVVGSAQLLIRPIVRLSRNLHLKRITSVPTGLLGSSHDF
ncbi:MAG TPA: YrhK family protein [Natronosporangium sp.]|jgi:hypothetical protein|nr:YrhK family protein [Natronosporangium sp.]